MKLVLGTRTERQIPGGSALNQSQLLQSSLQGWHEWEKRFKMHYEEERGQKKEKDRWEDELV